MKLSNNGIKIHTGISSIIMLLVILCLTTFGLLSYSTAKADLKLTEKAAQHTKDYYNADLKSERNVYKIYSELFSENNLNFDAKLSNLKNQINGLNSDFVDDSIYIIKFTIPVDNSLNLETIININLQSSENDNFKVTKQLISTQQFQEIQDIDVWQGI